MNLFATYKIIIIVLFLFIFVYFFLFESLHLFELHFFLRADVISKRIFLVRHIFPA